MDEAVALGKPKFGILPFCQFACPEDLCGGRAHLADGVPLGGGSGIPIPPSDPGRLGPGRGVEGGVNVIDGIGRGSVAIRVEFARSTPRLSRSAPTEGSGSSQPGSSIGGARGRSGGDGGNDGLRTRSHRRDGTRASSRRHIEVGEVSECFQRSLRRPQQEASCQLLGLHIRSITASDPSSHSIYGMLEKILFSNWKSRERRRDSRERAIKVGQLYYERMEWREEDTWVGMVMRSKKSHPIQSRPQHCGLASLASVQLQVGDGGVLQGREERRDMHHAASSQA